MTANGLEQQIAAYLKTLAESSVNSGSDFNQGVVRGLEIAAAQFEHGHAKNHVPSLALLDEAERVVEELADAATGLSHGTDWNNGTHAKTHGYRRKLLAALPQARAFLARVREGK